MKPYRESIYYVVLLRGSEIHSLPLSVCLIAMLATMRKGQTLETIHFFDCYTNNTSEESQQTVGEMWNSKTHERRSGMSQVLVPLVTSRKWPTIDRTVYV